MRNVQTCRELSLEELTDVVGGAGKTPAPQPKPTQLFEVEDYSFDIEQVLNVGS